MVKHSTLIVGAGHGGAQAAVALRRASCAGSIGIVGQEPDLPYERPPLSKEYLAGEKTFERILIRQPSFWEQRQVDIVTGTTIIAIDAAEHRAIAHDGSCYGYGSLIWAGAVPRGP
ncbi:FAD-dependent oxidoreductase [Sphingomonas sp. MMS24-JH45]